MTLPGASPGSGMDVGKLAAAAQLAAAAETNRDDFTINTAVQISWLLLDMGLNFTFSGTVARYDVEGRDDTDPYNLYGKIGYKFGNWAFCC